MATTTRQTTRNGAPPPRRVVATPTVTDSLSPQIGGLPPSGSGEHTSTTSGTNPFLTAFSIFMYGVSGIGKSSMWAHLPDVGYLIDNQEEGILELVKFGRVPKPKFVETVFSQLDAITFLEEVARKKHKIQSLVIESATGFEKLIFQDHCEREFEGDWGKGGFYGYQAGPKNCAKRDVPDFLDSLDAVRRAGINVVFTGHAQVKPFKNPNGADFDQYKPYLENDTWQQIHRWAQAVLFYDLVTEVGKEKGTLKNKAQDVRRVIITEPIGSCVAKNWWGLEGCINAGSTAKEAYDAFVTAYKKAARKGGNT